MTIRPGADWGRVVACPDDVVDVAGDAELAARLSTGGSARLRGGDLLATVGGPSATGCREYPIDVLAVFLDEGPARAAVAHVIVRRPGPLGWWRGPLTAVMNVSARRGGDIAPRAHPNDGRLDVVEVDAAMSVRDRLAARRRLPTGTHLPHPAIRTRRASSFEARWDRPMLVEVDGVVRGRARALRVELTPDGGTFLA